MAGTFRSGDVLFALPALLSQLRSGDVVVFHQLGESVGIDDVVVHRVRACTADGVRTQGDALAVPDAAVVHASQLIGRVVRVQRGKRTYMVFGGLTGRLWVCFVRFWRRLLALGRAPYRWLRVSGFIRYLWHPVITLVTLATEEGPVVKYLCSGKTVAIWQPKTHTYWCRKPYDLVLDAPGPTTNAQRINE